MEYVAPTSVKSYKQLQKASKAASEEPQEKNGIMIVN